MYIYYIYWGGRCLLDAVITLHIDLGSTQTECRAAERRGYCTRMSTWRELGRPTPTAPRGLMADACGFGARGECGWRCVWLTMRVKMDTRTGQATRPEARLDCNTYNMNYYKSAGCTHDLVTRVGLLSYFCSPTQWLYFSKAELKKQNQEMPIYIYI